MTTQGRTEMTTQDRTEMTAKAHWDREPAARESEDWRRQANKGFQVWI